MNSTTDHTCYTYMLQCADGTFYTGWTTNIEQRLSSHNKGTGAKYTRARLPVKLLASWSFNNKSQAMKFEWQLKQLSRAEKLAAAGSELKARKSVGELEASDCVSRAKNQQLRQLS